MNILNRKSTRKCFSNMMGLAVFICLSLVFVQNSPAPPILPSGPNKFQVTTFAYTPTSCTVTAQTMTFPTYDYLIAAQTATATVDITCTSGRGYTAYPDNGQNFTSTRRMVNGGNYLSYGLYQDSGHTQLWGQADKLTGIGTGANQSLTLYGDLPVGQAVPDGVYQDTVIMTVEYTP